MTEPSKERIAAALALAEAAESNGTLSEQFMAALQAYRATLPKLRTRAEVDAEIAALIRGVMSTDHKALFQSHYGRLEALCAEPIAEPCPADCPDCAYAAGDEGAPDHTDSGSGRDDDAGPPLVPPSPAGAANSLGMADGVEVIIHDHGPAFGCITLGDIKKACQLLRARVTVDCCGVGRLTMQYLRDNGIDAKPMQKRSRCKP